MFKRLLCVAAVAATLASSEAACAGNCNGAGKCGQLDRCECFSAFKDAADCSERVCPQGVSWNTGATKLFDICSGRGNCNKEEGVCECLEGYTGNTCQYTTCPQDCSGKGQCLSLFHHDSNYAGWDKHMTHACLCDPGYTGAACEKRTCPRGDDSLSVSQTNQVQECTITAAGTAMDGADTFVLEFTTPDGKKLPTWSLPATTLTELHVVEALAGLPDGAIPTVTVGGVSASTTSTTFKVTFSDPHNAGTQNLITISHADRTAHGNQPVHGIVTGTSITASCTEFTASTEENTECSGRGKCNSELGKCQCFKGYNGNACEQQTSLQ